MIGDISKWKNLKDHLGEPEFSSIQKLLNGDNTTNGISIKFDPEEIHNHFNYSNAYQDISDKWVISTGVYESKEIAMFSLAQCVGFIRYVEEIKSSSIDKVCLTMSHSVAWHYALKWLKEETLFGMMYNFDSNSKEYEYIKIHLATIQRASANELNDIKEEL